MRQPIIKTILIILLFASVTSCGNEDNETGDKTSLEQTDINDPTMQDYNFLDCMYGDPYFPEFLVDKCKNILIELCYQIEQDKPQKLDDLYHLTHAATDKINDLQNEFFENNSEIETTARECLAQDFEYIAVTYGFEADIEELIAIREW